MAQHDMNEYLDIDGALKRVLDNRKTFIMLMELFLGEETFGTLKNSLEKKDYAMAAEASHAIKGMAGNLSLPLLFDVSTRLNEELKRGEPNDETVQEYYDVLNATVSLVQHTIADMRAGLA